MANKGQKLKIPHKPDAIQAFEDEIALISQDLRDMRKLMAEKALDSVELKSGTFSFYLSELRQLAIEFKAEVGKQLARNSVRYHRANLAKKHK
jgi:hypothetical protein